MDGSTAVFMFIVIFFMLLIIIFYLASIDYKMDIKVQENSKELDRKRSEEISYGNIYNRLGEIEVRSAYVGEFAKLASDRVDRVLKMQIEQSEYHKRFSQILTKHEETLSMLHRMKYDKN